MKPDPRHYADRLVFWMVLVLCTGLGLFLYGEHRYQEGVASVKVPICKPAELGRQKVRAIVYQTVKECRL